MGKNGRKSSSLWGDSFNVGEIMYKYIFSTLVATSLVGSLAAEESLSIGAVQFSTCVSDSKQGKREQEHFESLRQQLASLIENAEKELRELSAKFEDTEYLDSLSPKGEEELKAQYQTKQEELGRYQGQFYQVLQHAHHQMGQKVGQAVADAAALVAKDKGFRYILNKEQCFYIAPECDLTTDVIAAMDVAYDIEAKAQEIAKAKSEAEAPIADVE